MVKVIRIALLGYLKSNVTTEQDGMPFKERRCR